MYSNEIGLEIVEAINTSLQLRDAYKRHITRITGKKGNPTKRHAKITAA